MNIQSKSLITKIRDGDITFNTLTTLTVFFFLFTFYSPSLLAAKQEIEKATHVEEIVIEGNTSEEKLANTFELIKLETEITEEEIAKRLEEEGNILSAILSFIGVKRLAPEKLEKLEQLNENMQALHEDTLAGFEDVEQMLKEKELPEAIIQRHYDAVEQYSQKFEEYKNK